MAISNGDLAFKKSYENRQKVATGLTVAFNTGLTMTPVDWSSVCVAVGISVVTTALYNFDVGGMKSFGW